MSWIIIHCDAFDGEYDALPLRVKKTLLAHQQILSEFGPKLGRPYVDTVKGSKHCNMKELRFQCDGQPYRFFFAFDPLRQAVVLVGGDKGNDAKFYERLIPVADFRYAQHLAQHK